MNVEEVREYCLSLPDTEEAMPYGEDWVVFRIGGKIYLQYMAKSTHSDHSSKAAARTWRGVA